MKSLYEANDQGKNWYLPAHNVVCVCIGVPNIVKDHLNINFLIESSVMHDSLKNNLFT